MNKHSQGSLTAKAAVSDISVFVAIPHNQQFAEIYDNSILPTVSELGLRINRVKHQNDDVSLIKEIAEKIENSDMFVAVTSGKNPHVYLEVGIAIAMQKPGILIASNPKDLEIFEDQFVCLLFDNDLAGFSRRLKTEMHKALLKQRT